MKNKKFWFIRSLPLLWLAFSSSGYGGNLLIFPFDRGEDDWQICQGYRTNTSHIPGGSLQYSFDFMIGRQMKGSTACWDTSTDQSESKRSIGKAVLAPGAGTIKWNGENDFDMTCLELDNPVSTGVADIKSLSIGHLAVGGSRRPAKDKVAQGQQIGVLIQPDGSPKVGPYSHIHILGHSDSGCGKSTGIPFGAAFGEGFNFVTEGKIQEHHGVIIPRKARCLRASYASSGGVKLIQDKEDCDVVQRISNAKVKTLKDGQVVDESVVLEKIDGYFYEYDSKGKFFTISYEEIQDDGSKEAVEHNWPFSDVAMNHAYIESATKAYKAGIINGEAYVRNGVEFKKAMLDEKIQRLDLTKFIIKAVEAAYPKYKDKDAFKPSPDYSCERDAKIHKNTCADLEKNRTDSLNWLLFLNQKGIIRGDADTSSVGTYWPLGYMEREQFMVALSRFYNYLQGKEINSGVEPSGIALILQRNVMDLYDDWYAVSVNFGKHLINLANQNVHLGVPVNSIDGESGLSQRRINPHGYITRGEALYLIMQLFQGEEK